MKKQFQFVFAFALFLIANYSAFSSNGLHDSTGAVPVNSDMPPCTASTEPVLAVNGPPTICAGSSITIGIVFGSLNSGTNWYWYSGSCGGTFVGTGTSITVSPSSTTTYFCRGEGSCFTAGTCANITVGVLSVSSTPTLGSFGTTICEGSSTIINISAGNLNSGNAWYFYSGSCGNSFVGVNGASVAPTTTTTYYARGEGQCGAGNCGSITITVNPKPTTPKLSASPTTICSGDVSRLSITSGSLNSATNWAWYAGNCNGNPVGSGNSINVFPTVTTTYYARGEGAGCPPGNCGSVTITVNQAASTPTISATATTICLGKSTKLSISSGNLNNSSNWFWYTNSCAGTPAGSGTSITVSPTTTTTYYARGEGTCTAKTCGSITIVVTDEPTRPTISASATTICKGNSVNLNISSGNLNGATNWYWYDATNNLVVLGTGTSISASPTSTRDYIVRGEGVCNGLFGFVTITVNSPELAPDLTATATTVCNGASTTLSITKGKLTGSPNWQWYSGSCGGTSVGSGNSVTVSPGVTTTYYARGDGGNCGSGACGSITINAASPSKPTLSSTSSSICNGSSTTLSIASGSLNGATNWYWYSGSCGGSAVGSGTSISVSPSSTTTYYARGEGLCSGACDNITITFTGPGAPTGTNAITGNQTISTQTQMDAFFSTVSGANYGKAWSKINGSLTLNGNHPTDPITSLCNLGSLTEITGTLLITNFNSSSNPTNLSQLSQLSTLGCNLTIVSNTHLQDATLSGLSSIGCSVNFKDNSALKTINMPNLATVQGGQFNIKNNPKLELASSSSTASSFSFTGRGSSIDISDNGSTAANALVMNFKKITTLNGALVFHNNDNTGVSNFDNIFTNLSSLTSSWAKLTITNNDYLGTCCIAASVSVAGSGKRHIISGNTGNCVDSVTVLANCGVFHKKSNSQGGLNNAFVEYNVYPNPSTGIFNLDVMSNQGGQLNLTITDLMGRTVLTETHAISQFTSLPVSLKSAASGTYFLKAELNGEVFVKRIVLSK